MPTEQLTRAQSIHPNYAQGARQNRRPKRNTSWLVSLIHYFSFGVDAYLLLTLAEKAAASEPHLVNTNLSKSIFTKPRKRLVILEQHEPELANLVD